VARLNNPAFSIKLCISPLIFLWCVVWQDINFNIITSKFSFQLSIEKQVKKWTFSFYPWVEKQIVLLLDTTLAKLMFIYFYLCSFSHCWTHFLANMSAVGSQLCFCIQRHVVNLMHVCICRSVVGLQHRSSCSEHLPDNICSSTWLASGSHQCQSLSLSSSVSISLSITS